jgi:hypothetical protein
MVLLKELGLGGQDFVLFWTKTGINCIFLIFMQTFLITYLLPNA